MKKMFKTGHLGDGAGQQHPDSTYFIVCLAFIPYSYFLGLFKM